MNCELPWAPGPQWFLVEHSLAGSWHFLPQNSKVFLYFLLVIMWIKKYLSIPELHNHLPVMKTPRYVPTGNSNPSLHSSLRRAVNIQEAPQCNPSRTRIPTFIQRSCQHAETLSVRSSETQIPLSIPPYKRPCQYTRILSATHRELKSLDTFLCWVTQKTMSVPYR